MSSVWPLDLLEFALLCGEAVAPEFKEQIFKGLVNGWQLNCE